ncbi:MAG: T9SS type A sorting domain-containing protein, partial [Bacteroidota bacterium]|nr:T9SS type A sorting domain-containing protein [Bacteroidota bacterium]
YLWQASTCASTGWICIEDTNAEGLYGAIPSTAGVTYYILVDDEDATVGTHTFYVNCLDLPTGIIENTEAPNVNISPNPNTGSFTISIDHFAAKDLQINIFNVLGEIVYSSKPENVTGKFNKEVFLGNVSKGVYMVQVSAGSKLYHKKIIVE